jgi:hypothetical protein
MGPKVVAASAKTARVDPMPADGHEDAPSGVGEFSGELLTADSRSDDEHGSIRQRCGIAVVTRMHLGDGWVDI